MRAAGGETAAARGARRELLLHDGVAFFSLTAIALVLYGVTFFLFRSFESHREELAKLYAAEGQADLTKGRAREAVTAMRASLSYAGDDQDHELLLAEALASDGRLDEAYNYFLSLRDARPGDGFINLQLARLEGRRGNVNEAVEFYRAAIFGDWRGDGIVRRRESRLELADYLLQHGMKADAHTELMIAESNAPDTEALDLLFAEKLRAAGDLAGALAEQRKALVRNPKSQVALVAAGETAFALGQYGNARGLLQRALAEKGNMNGAEEVQVRAMAHEADRMTELSLSRELPARERASHLRDAAGIAQARLRACMPADGLTLLKPGRGTSTPAPSADVPGPVVALAQRWRTVDVARAQTMLGADAEMQDAMAQLIFDTERTLADPVKVFAGVEPGVPGGCGAPSGDDAHLLALAARESETAGANE